MTQSPAATTGPATQAIRLETPKKPTQFALIKEDLGMPQLGDGNQRRGKGSKAAMIAAIVILLAACGVTCFFAELWKTDQGLKLDTSVFIQGQFRTFRAFVDCPRPRKTQLFCVVVSEAISHSLRDNKRYRTYRLEDFAYPKDFVSVPVLVDSEAGKVLSLINWRGMDRERVPRTATIELGWNDEAPSKIGTVICWEFLGVGGEIENTTPAIKPAELAG